ncbi:hypothetical protein B0I35DRAFT_269815 [Stachybotrys elegans]|uniref:Uncharacterized protein n=1 Tax=Stachybotrys elegans TaxID=80388 RepID=A0A8K0WPH4_9HYPO|nr:hypothetical protein B0I35DRAFT_269815 [Stachybotrys elegans]
MPEELPFWGINKDGRFPINYSSTQTHMNNPPVTSAEERHQSSECPKLDLLNGMHGNSLARSSTFRASLEQAADDINDKYGLSRIPSSSEEPFPLSGDTSNCPAASLGRYVKPSSKHVSTDGTLPDRPKSGSYMEKKEPCVPDDSQCESSKETPVNEPNEASEEPLRPQDAAGSEVSPA